ncbi:MAG: 3-phosphoserine/phosphohydroxythreonine transaminase, partial [Salinisphaera sp.]|nr:3-phosphoserine/phosphohydroxythreonine transaminase [Salinisphaera sp.]
MTRIYNFSAGPATLPVEVLEQAQAEMLDWDGRGMSVMEMSHRGEAFMSIAEQAHTDLRLLFALPDNYRILFLAGGATGHFAAVPKNLPGTRADYVLTGNWSKKASKEAGKYLDVGIAASAEEQVFTEIPPQTGWRLCADAAYVHITANETIQGVEFADDPVIEGGIPLAADMSSNFLSRPLDVSRYGVIYAGAQKNAGPAGVTIVLVREDLLGRAQADTPMVLDWKAQADADSMLNTPPCYAWYVCGLVFAWLRRQGGLDAMAQRNARKADKLYRCIDASGFYSNPVAVDARSRMNVPFLLADEALHKRFLDEAQDAGLAGLKGHRAVGGMRASIYNAMP